jgi:hypothetical protein
MPALKNPRHEAFAQAIFKAICRRDLYPTQGTAYQAAGYIASGVREKGGSAETNASRLLRKAQIFDRVAELQAEVAEQAKETVEKLVAELNKDRQDAKADKAHSAAISAVMGKAKLLGLITEKHQNVGDGADFSQAKSLDEIGQKLLLAVGFATPSPADVELALKAHAELTAKLEAIAEKAGVVEH